MRILQKLFKKALNKRKQWFDFLLKIKYNVCDIKIVFMTMEKQEQNLEKLKSATSEGMENQESDKKERRQEKKTSFVFEIIKIVLISFLIIFPIRTFVFQPFFVKGSSMEPNFLNGEYLIINELGYKKTVVAAGEKEIFTVDSFKELERGTPVVFRYPRNPEEFFIKRVIGLPNERVLIKNKTIKIFNDESPEGFLLDERDYIPNHFETRGEEDFVLEGGQYVVLGDNRSHSSDSRNWGILSSDYIVGKVLLRAWPVDRFKLY